MTSRKLTFYLGVLIVASLSSGEAVAYLDPATGSILLQGLLAAIAGIAVTGKLYWSKIKSFFSRTPANAIAQEPENDSTPKHGEPEQ